MTIQCNVVIYIFLTLSLQHKMQCNNSGENPSILTVGKNEGMLSLISI